MHRFRDPSSSPVARTSPRRFSSPSFSSSPPASTFPPPLPPSSMTSLSTSPYPHSSNPSGFAIQHPAMSSFPTELLPKYPEMGDQNYYQPDDLHLQPRLSHSESLESCDQSFPENLLDFDSNLLALSVNNNNNGSSSSSNSSNPPSGLVTSSSQDLGGMALKFNSCKLDTDAQLAHQQQVYFEHNQAQLMQQCFMAPMFDHPLPERRHSSPNLRSIDIKYFSEKRPRLDMPLHIDTKLTQVNAPLSGEDVFFCKDLSPDSDELSCYSGDSMEEDESLPAPPNTRVMDNKPRRGGRHKKDGRPREELLPPPSPRTLNDPDLMQDYRQERNRLAAKRSRERKKDYIKQLESTCKALKNHGEELSRELIKAKKEISELKGKQPRKKSIC